MKIDTKKYGEKNLLEKKPINGTNELFIGEISHNSGGSRYRVQGILDQNYREVVPFGELHRMIGTRIINDSIVIIDCVAVAGECNVGWCDEYGSLLLMKHNGEFKIAYNSNASIIYATENMLYGANYEASAEDAYCQQYCDTSYPVETFEYDYKNDCLINQEKLGDVSESQIQAYFYSKILPYPNKMLKLKKMGEIGNQNMYQFKR